MSAAFLVTSKAQNVSQYHFKTNNGSLFDYAHNEFCIWGNLSFKEEHIIKSDLFIWNEIWGHNVLLNMLTCQRTFYLENRNSQSTWLIEFIASLLALL